MLFALKNEYLNFALLAAQYDQIARIDLQFGWKDPMAYLKHTKI